MIKQIAPNFKYTSSIKIWLIAGLFMLLVQVIVGGITRLTGSGLSITKWEIVTGTIPPLNEADWTSEFDLYKGTPQYKEINEGMSMSEFKFIYFWEYIHRFWARIMGIVFLFPFVYFFIKGYMNRPLIRRLGLVVLLAALAASFGWIMVASGLIERPWVNAYKLAVHLCIAFMVFGYLLWTFFFCFRDKLLHIDKMSVRLMIGFMILLSIQIFAGGVMSGMKAGVVYPTWPDMNGDYIPQLVFNMKEYTVENFNYYDRNILLPTLVHVVHRFTAYLVFSLGLYIAYRLYKLYNNSYLNRSLLMLVFLLVIQVLLGIITVISCQGKIPVALGVMHQTGALLLFASSLYVFYIINADRSKV